MTRFVDIEEYFAERRKEEEQWAKNMIAEEVRLLEVLKEEGKIVDPVLIINPKWKQAMGEFLEMNNKITVIWSHNIDEGHAVAVADPGLASDLRECVQAQRRLYGEETL